MTVSPPILIPLFIPFCERLCMMLPEALSDAVIWYQWEAHSVGLVERHAHMADNCLLITLLTRVRERGLQGAPLPTAEWNTVLAPPPSREPRACYCPQPLSGATVSPRVIPLFYALSSPHHPPPYLIFRAQKKHIPGQGRISPIKQKLLFVNHARLHRSSVILVY